MANEIKIKLHDPDPVELDFSNKVVLKYIEPDHTKLAHLDYDSSGHTGFMPAELTKLPELPTLTKNSNLTLSVYNSETSETNSISFNSLKDRIIKTSSNEDHQNDQEGQYIFLEIKED